MSDYESIHGTRVKYLTSDPTLDSSVEGQVWYNSTSGTNKALVQIKAFSSAGSVPTQFYYAGGVGGVTDTLGIAGVGPSPQPAHNLCIEYSGFSWFAQPNLNTNRRAPYTFGTSTACVASGGDYSPASPTLTQATEEWDGSSWTSVTNMPNEQGSFGASSGILTAGLVYGGYGNPQSTSVRTVAYDGTNWTAYPTPGGDTNDAGNFTGGGGGTQTAAIFSGGSPYAIRGVSTETFDGSSWTNVNNMNSQRSSQGMIGTQANGLYIGGRTPARTAATEEWDGSVWSTSPASLSTARNGSILSKSGSTSGGALIAAGYTGTAYPTTTEEYNSNINALTQASWSSGGALSTGRSHGNGAGSQTAGLYFGGSTGGGSHVNNSEEYNGSSWTEGNNLNTARRYMSGAGTQTSAITAGGIAPPADTAAVEEYDGTSWSNGTSLPAARRLPIGLGVSTAAVVFGGSQPYTSPKNTTFNYDGSSWTSGGSYPISLVNGGACGTQTAGLGFGGSAPPYTGVTAEYDGSSWTASNSLIYARDFLRGGGIQTSAYAVSGANPAFAPGVTVATEQYDGTSWANVANQATSRPNGHAAATNTADNTTGLVFSGPSNNTATEEFTGGTSVTTASTLTTS